MKGKLKIKLQASGDTDVERKRALARERSRRYRMQMKADPVKYAEYKEKSMVRNRDYRRNMSDEQKFKCRQQTCLRQRKYAANKLSTQTQVTPKTLNTWSQQEKRRIYERDKKRRQRQNLSSQRKRWIRLKDRDAKREKRAKLSTKSMQPPCTPEETSCATPNRGFSNVARRKAISRLRRRIPKDPEMFASIISGVIENVSPRTKAALGQKGVISSPNKIGRKLEFLDNFGKAMNINPANKESTRKVKRATVAAMSKLKKYKLLREAPWRTGIRWKYMMRYSKLSSQDSFDRKTRNDKISSETVKHVTQFYENEATILPNRKLVKKDHPGRILWSNVEQLHAKYLEENQDQPVGLSPFAKLRPLHVLPANRRRLIQCLCEYCTNIEEHMKIINNTCSTLGLSDLQIRERLDLLRKHFAQRKMVSTRKPALIENVRTVGFLPSVSISDQLLMPARTTMSNTTSG